MNRFLLTRTIDPLLALCARARSHPSMQDRLRRALEAPIDWPEMVLQAEYHRMGPMLYRHLLDAGARLPAASLLALKGMQVSTNNANLARLDALEQILLWCQANGPEVLVLKGAALVQLVYPDLSLRPMADLDLWVRPDCAKGVFEGLKDLGFEGPASPWQGIDEDNQHCAPLVKNGKAGLITVEIHRQLLNRQNRDLTRGLSFEGAWNRSQLFSLRGLSVHALGKEDSLWHVYCHACRNTLRGTIRDFRLHRIADLVSAVEAWADQLDWDAVQNRYPELLRALPMLHFLTPWSPEVIRRVPMNLARPPQKVGQIYLGYPSRYASEHVRAGLLPSLRDTFYPPEWWFRLHYAVREGRWPYALGLLYHAGRVLSDLAVYLARLALGREHPERTAAGAS